MRTLPWLIGALLSACAFCEGAESRPSTIPADLKRQADDALRADIVGARDKLGPVYEYADAMARSGRLPEGMKYQKEALQRDAWNMKEQLRYAEMLIQSGDRKLGLERARTVAATAEEGDLVARALCLLGKTEEANTSLPPLAKVPGNDPVVVVLPMGGGDVLLAKDVAAALEAELGIRVLVQEANLVIGTPDRDRFKQAVDHVRDDLVENKDNKDVQKLLKAAGVEITDVISKDDAVVRVLKTSIAEAKGEKAAAAFEVELHKLKGVGRQWLAENLVQPVIFGTEKVKRARAVYLGFTPLDMYAKDTNFLFGMRIGEYSAVSYYRFLSAPYGENPNRKRLIDRCVKQCLSSIGHMFGLPRCSSPRCARTYPNGLDEQDAKPVHLCPECKEAFRKVFGLTPSTKEAF